ncbi:hypothetical protein Bca4012_037257 [Brassica carinata]
MAGDRNRLRNRGRGTSYGSTFLDQTDPSAASTSRTPDNVPDSQIPSIPQAVDHVAPYIPQYDDAAYFTYEEPRHDQQPHDPQTHDQQPAAYQPAAYQPPHQAPAAPGLHPDLLVAPKKRGRIPGIGSVNDVPRARVEYAARTWQTLRSNFAVSDPTPEEQADLHRRAEQRSSELLDDINLNS